MSSRLFDAWRQGRASRRSRRDRPSPEGDGLIRVRVHVEYDELDEVFIAKCVDLAGCISYGATEREAIENVIEAFTGVMIVRLQSRAREAMDDAGAEPSGRYGRDLALTV